MKKFLSVLLALAVAFTFTFGSCMSAFAVDTPYTVSTATVDLNEHAADQLALVQRAESQALAELTYDPADGKCDETGLTDYTEAGVKAAAAKVEKDAEKALKAEVEKQVGLINTAIKDGTTITDLTAPTDYKGAVTAVVTGGTYDLTVKAEFLDAVKAEANTVFLTAMEQESYDAAVKNIAESFVPADYPNEGSFKSSTYAGTYTAQQVVENAISYAKNTYEGTYSATIVGIDNIHADILKAVKAETVTAANLNKAIADYAAVMTTAVDKDTHTATGGAIVTYIGTWSDGTATVKTTKQIEKDKKDNADAQADAKKALATYANGAYYSSNMFVKSELTNSEIASRFGPAADTNPLYTPATATKKATVCGVEISATPTAAEATAVNEALKKNIADALALADLYVAAKAGNKYTDLYTGGADFTETIKAVYAVNKMNEDIATYAANLKGEVALGKKVYDDAKVDAAVAATTDYVYANLAASTVEAYIVSGTAKAQKDTTIDTIAKAKAALVLVDENNISDAIAAAKKAANDKFDKAYVASGADATPAEDVVYKAEMYDGTSVAITEDFPSGQTYAQIKTEAKDAISAAQNIADIDAALAAAKAKLEMLVLKADAKKVSDAKIAYKASFDSYVAAQYSIYGSTDYSKAFNSGSYTNLKADAYALIEKANTVDGVKAAYAEAQKLIEAVKKNDEIKAAEDSLKAKVAALPYSTQITADKAADVEAVRAEYDALAKVYGSEVFGVTTPSGSYAKLAAAEAKLAAIEKETLTTALTDLVKKIDAIGNVATNDTAATAAIELKAEAAALKDKIEAYNKANASDKITGTNATKLTTFVDTTVKNAEIHAVEAAIAALPANITGADKTAVEAAKAAYDALTDTQKASVQNAGYLATLSNAVNVIAAYDAKIAELKADLKTAKVTTKNVKTKKIKVTGYKNAKAEYYQVQYKKSTAKSWKYATKKTTSTTKTIKVTKKGTYKVRVRACVKMDDGTIVKGAWKTVTRKVTK